jgi:hypothetical protein
MSLADPHTAREFADSGRNVLVSCRCGHVQFMDPEMIVFMLGEDFPLATSVAVLSAAISCEACGDAKPAITLGQPTDDETVDFVVERPSRRFAGARG